MRDLHPDCRFICRPSGQGDVEVSSEEDAGPASRRKLASNDRAVGHRGECQQKVWFHPQKNFKSIIIGKYSPDATGFALNSSGALAKERKRIP